MCGYDVGVGEEAGWRTVYEETVGTKNGGINICKSRYQIYFSGSTIRICTAHTERSLLLHQFPIYCKNIGQARRLSEEF
jgi:hypothetical protein